MKHWVKRPWKGGFHSVQNFPIVSLKYPYRIRESLTPKGCCMHYTSSLTISVRFTLISTKTHECVHMFIKIPYMTFPLLVAWRKWHPYMCFLFLPSMLHRCLGQGCTSTRRQVVRETKFLTQTLNVFEFSMWYLLHITALAPRILRWHLDF
jgi:hypothetical protein